MDPDGSNQVNLSQDLAADDGQPVIGPDGRIAFISSRDGNLEIYTMAADGGEQTRLTNSPGNEGWMDWSPEGDRLVFVYNEGATWRLESMNADGSGRTILLEENDDLYDATWSPDGTTIAFFWADAAAPGVYTMPASGGNATKLPLGAAEEPAWSPDGSQLAVTLVDYITQKSWIYVTDLSGSQVVQASPGASFTLQDGKRTGGDAWPSWSPDGRRIIYSSSWGGGFDMLYLALADGSNAGTHVNLSTSIASDYQPDWGPGGFIPPATWGPLVAYQTGNVDGSSAIHLYDSDTAQDTVVVQEDDLRLASLWANWLVYQKPNSDGSYDIWVQALDSGTAVDISLDLPASSSNRPYVTGGRVYWRQVQGTATAIGAGFYEYDLVTGATFLDYFYPNLFYRYSRYQAQDGWLAFVHESNQLYLVDLEDLVATALPFGGVALPGGVSGNTVAVLEHGAGGNDVLATYVISPSSRVQISAGLDRPPALSADFLAWTSGGELYRQHLFDDAAAGLVAADAGTFTQEADLLLWLDRQGTWSSTQGDAAPIYLGLADFEGDADFTEPEETVLLAPHTGDWKDRWLATVTGGQVCYLDGGLRAGQEPHCVTKTAGFRIYPHFEIYIQPGYTADFTFRDGSTMLARGGTYMVFQPYSPSSTEVIQTALDETFDVLTLLELQNAVEAYQQSGDTTSLDLGKLNNDLTAISSAAEALIVQAEAGMAVYTSAGRQAPRILQLVSGGLDAVSGISDRLGSVFGIVQLIENTSRFNYPFYRDKLNVAFKDYFESIARAQKLGSGTVMYTPRDPNSNTYFNRAEVLLRMFLRDGRTCFEERNWTAAFLEDGTFLITSPNCPTVQWSKEEIASLIAAADADVLRREVLRPLYKNSLDWYNNVIGLFVPGEASLAFSLLTGNSKPKQVVINKGRMRFEKLSALKRAIDAKLFRFPGAKVLVWGTAFEGEIGDDGSGTAFVEEGMPVLANLNGAVPDRYGVTWQDNSLVLPASPGTDPLDLPQRESNNAPFVVDLTPNENMALTPGDFAVQIRFSQVMDAASVTSHGLLTMTHSTQGEFFAGILDALPHTWDSVNTTLTLTPTATPEPGLYQLDLLLPPGATSLAGISVEGTPITVQFMVAGTIGAGGGTINTVGGAALTIPAAGANAGTQAPENVNYQIQATRIFTAPPNLMAADGLATLFTPEDATFASPATLTLPVPEAREGAAIYRYGANEWVSLGGEASADGKTMSVTVDQLGLYSVLWPVPRFYGVYLPLITNGQSTGSSAPTVGPGWQCDPFAGGVSCGQLLKAISFGAPEDGWAAGYPLLHYANGKWSQAIAADLDLYDGSLPLFNDVDMLSAEEGWAVAQYGVLAHFQDGVWHTSRPFYETYYGVDMLTADDGWIAASNGMTYHYNGDAWQEVNTPVAQPLYDVKMVASGNVWAVGGDNFGNSVILHYSGGSWQQVPSPTSLPLYALDMLSANEGWAGGQSGVLLRYQSGSWTQVSSPSTTSINDILMLSAEEGWVVDAWGQIYHYQSGTWTEVGGQSPDDGLPFYALASRTPGEIWAVGDGGGMFYTQEGPWVQFAGVSDDSAYLNDSFNAIDMVSNTDGWAAGHIGHIIHYDGSGWSYVPSPTADEINDLEMLSASNGWAVASKGYSGTDSAFLHYDGSSWQVVQNQSGVQLGALDMVSASEGWAVGNSGVIMHYSGGSWSFAPSPTLEDLNAVAMDSATEGWAVGDNGAILHYDAGTWETVTSPTNNDLLDISILSDVDIWASGENSTILRAFLGGWFQVPVPVVTGTNTPDLEAIYMLPGGEGWAAGFYHRALHYQNGAWEVYAEWVYGYDMDFLPNGEGWLVGNRIIHKP